MTNALPDAESDNDGYQDRHHRAMQVSGFTNTVDACLHIANRLASTYPSLYLLAHERGRHGDGSPMGAGSSSAVEADWSASKPVREQLGDASWHTQQAYNALVKAKGALAAIGPLLDKTIPQRIEPGDDRQRERSVYLDEIAAAYERKARDCRSQAQSARRREDAGKVREARRAKARVLQYEPKERAV